MKFKTLRTIRRSLKGDEGKTHKLPPRASAPAAAMIPPKRVIRAMFDFTAESVHELSFREGDFFHVIGNENDPDWFEAYNPLTNVRGMVPVSFFQVLGKTAADAVSTPPMPTGAQMLAQSYSLGGLGGGSGNDSGSEAGRGRGVGQLQRHTTSNTSQHHSQQRSGSQPRSNSQTSNGAPDRPRPPKREPLYGVMLYDFQPERPDELAASEGDALVIIAQSNEEWFIGMHPGKLGGPGLIPVAFVEIRDPNTGLAISSDLESWMYSRNIQLPGVEEWKRMQEGKSGRASSGSAGGATTRQASTSNASSTAPPPVSASSISPAGNVPHMRDVVSGGVASYLVQDDQYWFHIQLQMRGNPAERTVYRLYEDFYNFQINLLDTFPAEAGRGEGSERILPYMPGPLSFVNDIITSQRREGLDQYVKELLELPSYIRECELMHAFFGLLEDEEENEVSADAGAGQDDALDEQEMMRQVADGERPNDLFAAPPPDRVSAALPSEDTANALLKIKVQFGDDILALRVPSRVTFAGLWDRVRDRLGHTVRRLEWKDINTGQYRPLDDGEDLQRAMAETGGKLLLLATT